MLHSISGGFRFSFKSMDISTQCTSLILFLVGVPTEEREYVPCESSVTILHSTKRKTPEVFVLFLLFPK